jgi:hypothetical protein
MHYLSLVPALTCPFGCYDAIKTKGIEYEANKSKRKTCFCLAEEEEKNTGERYCEALPDAQVPEGDAEGVTRTIWADR